MRIVNIRKIVTKKNGTVMFNVLKTEDPCNSALNDQQKGIEPGTIGKEISNTDD